MIGYNIGTRWFITHWNSNKILGLPKPAIVWYSAAHEYYTVGVRNHEIFPETDARIVNRCFGAGHPCLQLVTGGVSHRTLLDVATPVSSLVWAVKV